MFLERTKELSKDVRPFRKFRTRHWMPLLVVPVAACLAVPDTNSQNIASSQQAFTGLDVPSSHASSPNGQYTWTPKVNGIPHEIIAVSPDGAFYLHSDKENNGEFYLSTLELTDSMVSSTTSVDFSTFGAGEAIPLGATLGSALDGGSYQLGELSAVSFNPRHGLGSFRVDDPQDCHSDAGTPAQVGVPNGPYDCYRMLAYAQIKDSGVSPPMCYVAIAPLHIALKRDANLQTTEIVSAGFDKPFELIRNGGNPISVHQGTNPNSEPDGGFSGHFTATADGRLIVFDAKPYYAWSEDPLEQGAFTEPKLLWSVNTFDREKTVCLGMNSATNSDCVRFDQAYPIFRTPFKFPNGFEIATTATGCGYPWITPDGSDLFCNAGHISALTMIGQSTRGTIQHVDARVQTSQQRYCRATTAESNNSCMKEPPKGALGTTACSPRGLSVFGCEGDSVTRGTQRVTSLGAATGPWKARPAPGTNLTRFPLMHRSPSLLMMSENSALAAFGETPDARAASFIYFEVATDAAVDPDFLAFFHMNEAIVPIGSTGPSTWHEKAPFKDNNPAANVRAIVTADAAGHGFVGTLNDCAQFPFDRFGGIEHRTTAPPNPGFLGRAIYFQLPDGKVDIASTQANHRLLEARSAMTLELAVKPQNLPLTLGKTVLVSAAGAFALSFERTQGTSGVVTNVTFEATNALAPVVFPNIDLPSDDTALHTGPYTHLVLTYEGSATANQAAVKLYRNGEFAGSGILTGANSLPSRPTGTAPLCIGPGCATGSACTPTAVSPRPELLIDEVAISAVVRTKDYIAAAAAVDGPADVFVPGDEHALLPNLPLGLLESDIRIPKAILEEINTGTNRQEKFARIAALGKALFIDDVLSVNPTGTNVCGGRITGRTCSSCHLPGNHFASPGVETNLSLDTNTPSLLNRVFSTRQLKDRSEPSLVHQAERVISNPVEMHGNLAKVAACLSRTNSPENMPVGYPPAGIANYREWFNYAFAGSKDATNPVTQQQVVLALGAYELTLVRGNSAVDQMLAPGGTGTGLVPEGLRIFQGKGRCQGCHSGANFTDELRHATTFDEKALKTPSLRNVAATNPYFHDGTKGNLRAVIEHYNRCGAVNLNLDPNTPPVWSNCAPELVALGLTEGEMDALEAFLAALTSNP